MTAHDWPDRAGFAIGAAALTTSAVTAYKFVGDHGGDLMHQLATPFCLEALALVALARRRTWMFWPPFIVAVAINVWHGYPNGVLMGVYALPPIAAIMAGHTLLHGSAVSTGVDEVVGKRSADGESAEYVRSDSPTAVHMNGHKPLHTRTATADELATLIPDIDTMDRLRGQHGTIKAIHQTLGVTRDQLNAHRRKIGDLQ